MKQTLKRLALICLGVTLAIMPGCWTELRPILLPALTSALGLLAGCALPIGSPVASPTAQQGPVNNAPNANAQPQQTVGQSQCANPVITLNAPIAPPVVPTPASQPDCPP